ncbi:MAG TPA: TetR/AcrR family transcriptional regulator [Thermoclostridium sp.]|jgi:AcrR family transcriptional regulator|nr:TetR/AcrR family transcriptional regulator [Clostridiaceae bacterium]HOQ75340.1 TetR/AcrR family transcriptional regulator [Thermoclostridium sp.]HPU45631.1 TetR/AcrR family transcriptional regulator [Thermoclostridium sp.]
MQYLKDEVKAAIKRAALEEFGKKSYSQASMRAIAKNAGITVGNIYRYFPSKDELFNDIMDPAWQAITRAIFDQYNEAEDPLFISGIISAIMVIYRKYTAEIYILFHNSKDSKYENIKSGLVELIAGRLEKDILAQLQSSGRKVKDPYIFKIIANAIVDSFYLIIRELRDDFDRVEALMEKTITVLVKDLHKRL